MKTSETPAQPNLAMIKQFCPISLDIKVNIGALSWFLFVFYLALICFSNRVTYASESSAREEEHICRIIEVKLVGDGEVTTNTLCLEDESRCGYEAGQHCAIGGPGTKIRKSCGRAPKDQCKSGSKRHRLH